MTLSDDTYGRVDAAVGHEDRGPNDDIPTCCVCGAVYMDRALHVMWHLRATVTDIKEAQ